MLDQEKTSVLLEKKSRSIPSSLYFFSFALFAMGSAEFLMGGILPMIALDLNISLPLAGSLISAFSIGAFFGGPILAVFALNRSIRHIFMMCLAVFAICLAIGLWLNTYVALAITRVIMGFAYACFFSIAAATAVKLVAPQMKAKALSILVSGLTIAMIIGGPIGTYLSSIGGWHAGFWAVFGLTLIASLAALFLSKPKTDGQDNPSNIKVELQATKSLSLWAALATTALTTASYMGVFSYSGAVLIEVSHVAPLWVGPILILFGVGAFLGLILGGMSADKHPLATIVIANSGLLVTAILIVFMAQNAFLVTAAIFLLGFFGFLLNPVVWSRVFHLAPNAPTLAGALNNSAFQLGLTFAPLLTAIPIANGYGLPSIGWVAALIVISAFLAIVIDRICST